MVTRRDAIVEIRDMDPGTENGTVSIRMESGSEILLWKSRAEKFKVGDVVTIRLQKRRD